MFIDSRAFRHTVGHFATGVTVIATEFEGGLRAMTANSFASLSLDPPLVLFCLGKTAHLALSIRTAPGFSVNVLAEDQRDLSAYFAGGWKQVDPPPFVFTPWEGGPRLEGCIAALGCAIEAIHEGGDHWIVVGKVLTLYQNDAAPSPLLFFGGRYAALADPADLPK